MKKKLIAVCFSVAISAFGEVDLLTYRLGLELLREGQPDLATVEFRRLAAESEAPSVQAVAYCYASYAALQANQASLAQTMVDRAEEADEAFDYEGEITLLNGEIAHQQNNIESALYYYELLANTSTNHLLQTYSLRRAAALSMRSGNPTAAKTYLSKSPSASDAALTGIDTYLAGNDKSPTLGGWLGLIPGAGYWYSGEWGNGLRSLILNSLFMYGMADTAEKDQWGAFGVITFFEITWYTGSIYGGIDAAHRYNRTRLDQSIEPIERNMNFRPDIEWNVPVFRLHMEF